MYNQTDAMENPKQFYGKYRGIVESVNDPMRAGRVRVRVYGVYDNLPTNAIPWAERTDPLYMNSGGGFMTPDVGTLVWVEFEAGNHMLPILAGGAPSLTQVPNTSVGGNPNIRTIQTAAGHYIVLDDSSGDNRIVIHHASGTVIDIDDTGNMNQNVVQNLNINVTGNANITVEGDVTEQVNGNVKRTVSGNVEETINGDYSRQVGGSSTEESAGETSISGSRVNINE